MSKLGRFGGTSGTLRDRADSRWYEFFFFSLLNEVPIRKLRFMKPNIANCYGKNEKGIGACHMSRYAKFDYNRKKKNIYFFFFLDKSMKCCTLGKHSTYGQESLHSLGTGKQFPNSQLLSVADIQRRTLSLCVWKLPRTPTFQAHERSRLNFSAQSVLWTVAAKKKKRRNSSDIYFFCLGKKAWVFELQA